MQWLWYNVGECEKIRAVGYVRISTNEDKQKYGLKVQVSAIQEYARKHELELFRIYRDTRSGKSLQRPGIQRLLTDRAKFQVVVIFKLDRLSRSVLDLLKLLREELKGHEVVFLEEGIDQRTKEGRLFLTQLASFAEYERELIVSRIKNGLAEAKKKGVRLGAEPIYPKYRKQAQRMREQGMTLKEISQELGINFRTVKKCLER